MMRLLKEPASFVARLWAYLPIIWHDVDYDYFSILRLMRFKIGRIRKHIKKHDLRSDTQSQVRRMWIVEQLLTRLIDSNYGSLEWQQLCDKWGELEFVKLSDGTGATLRHKLETPENKEEINKAVLRMAKASADQEEADWKWLWEMLAKHMRNWWD